MTQQQAVSTGPASASDQAQVPPQSVAHAIGSTNLYLLGLLLVASLWAYWPTMSDLVDTWNREPDYSHGFLVIPLFAFFLYLRRDSMPAVFRPSWLGLLLLCISIGLRFVGGWFFITPIDGWSIVFWVSGVVLCLGGWSLFRWALAPILFLFFMVPLPFRAETMISQPLQQVAAQLSAFVLRCLGQPAFANDTTLLVGNSVLEVEQSCSGLRIFVGIFALAFGYLIAFRRELWEAVLLLISAIPVALVANATRIVLTAILFQYFTEEAAHQFSHDAAGWLMIPLAAALLGGVQWYMNCLMRDVESGEVADTINKPDPVTA